MEASRPGTSSADTGGLPTSNSRTSSGRQASSSTGNPCHGFGRPRKPTVNFSEGELGADGRFINAVNRHVAQIRRWLAVHALAENFHLTAVGAECADDFLHVDRAAFRAEDRHARVGTDVRYAHPQISRIFAALRWVS